MKYIAVEYSLTNLMPIAKDGQLVTFDLGEHESDESATSTAADLLNGRIARRSYIARKDRRFTVFNELEYHELLTEIEGNTDDL